MSGPLDFPRQLTTKCALATVGVVSLRLLRRGHLARQPATEGGRRLKTEAGDSMVRFVPERDHLNEGNMPEIAADRLPRGDAAVNEEVPCRAHDPVPSERRKLTLED
jgi:hypothetical protein